MYAFAGVAVLHVVAALVSWWELRDAQLEQQTLLEETLPASLASQQLAAHTSVLAQYAQLLAGIDTIIELDNYTQRLAVTENSISAVVENSPAAASPEVASLLTQFNSGLKDAMQAKRVALTHRLEAGKHSVAAQETVRKLAIDIELALEANPRTFDDNATRVREITTLISGWSGLLRALEDTNSPQSAARIRDELVSEIRRVTRNLVEHKTLASSESNTKALHILLATAYNDSGLYAEQTKAIQQQQESVNWITNALILAVRLNDTLGSQALTKAEGIASQSSDLTRRMRQTEFILIALSISAVLLSLFYIHKYVIEGVAKPLEAIAYRTQKLADGDLTGNIPTQEFEELNTIRSALEVFRAKLKRLQDSDEEMRAQNNLLNETIEDLNRFTYAASHDLRSPLRGVATLAGFLREDLANSITPAVAFNLDRMQARLEQMEALLEDLLTYSRAGRKSSTSIEVDLETLTMESLEMVDSQGVVKLKLRLSEPRIIAPRTVMSQILRNIIDNSIKHHHHPEQGIKLEVSSYRANEFFVLAVTDDGPGIDQEYRSRVMELFQTLASDSQSRGSGIGLSLVRKLVQKYGGDIRITEPNKGSGACVLVYWPQVPHSSGNSSMNNFISQAAAKIA